MHPELQQLRQLVLSYERDPLHKITKEHQTLRMACVVKFGSEAVVQVVNSVCQQMWEERTCQFAVFVAKKPSSPSPQEKKKSSTEPVRLVRPKKTSTTHRKGFRVSTHRK